jgi:hypothetical protein
MGLWTALLVGLAGSIHCIGMCGPIALALPLHSRAGFELLLSRINYNVGRVITYGILGGVAGIAGQGLFLGGTQQWLSILSGVILILSVIVPSSLFRQLSVGLADTYNNLIKEKLGSLLARRKPGRMFMIGILNGFLPCGLVYVALTGALNTGQAFNASLYMILFGLGTFPVMLAVSIFGQFIGTAVRNRISRLIPVFVILLGVLFILRGMNLGIKYISPSVRQNQKTEMPACH